MPHPEEYRNKKVVISVADGGTGATTAAAARSSLGAAASGANSDITSLSALTSVVITGLGTMLRLASTIFQDCIAALDTLSGGTKASISFREATVETFTINYYGSIYGGGLDGQLWFTSLNNKPFNFSTGGVTVLNVASTGITVLGQIKHSNTTLLYTSVALANGAAAAAGTLTNAPAAGNPTKWIPINDNGTVRYIPAW